MPNDLIPVSDEQAKLLMEALKTLQGFGEFLREILGTVPEDLVALCGGDWLKVRRLENLAGLLHKLKEHLRARGVTHTEPANLKIALPIFEAAANEGREELQDMWARLLASAVDPKRAGQVRADLIDAAKRLEPLDAAVLNGFEEARASKASIDARAVLAHKFKVTKDAVIVALLNLQELGFLTNATGIGGKDTAKGRMLLQAVRD
jgi:hypothetical protein